MKLNAKQQEAVYASGQNIIVSASAGAGKTGVLTQRLKYKVLDAEKRIPLDRIVALTFTSAAAQEMKDRISKELNNCLALEKYKDDQDYIKQQLVLLSSCEITTIDAFCLNIIKRYYPTIGLNPALCNQILDEGLQKMYQSQAFKLALKDLKESNPEGLLDLFLRYGPRAEDYDSLKDIVLKIITAAKSSNQMEEWFEHASQSYAPITSFQAYDKSLKDAFFSSLELSYQSIFQSFYLMKEIGQSSEKVMKKVELFPLFETGLTNCYHWLEEKNYDLFQESFLNFLDQTKTPTDSNHEEYTKARDRLYKDIDALLKDLYDSSVFLEDQKELDGIAKTLVDLARRTEANYAKIKQDHACMDFEDMEHYAYEILVANDYEISNLLKSMYDEVMVDEFQDTSFLQNDIIELVAKKDTIFRVGDVKQSIYRFRGAKPDLMRQLMKEENNRVIVLGHNYRSKDNIVEFCNLLFQELMNVEGCKDTYLEEDCVQVGSDFQRLCKPNPVRFVLVHKDENGLKKDNKQLKAEWIANQMLHLYQTSRPKTLGDPNPSTYQFKDFAVLVKSHADKAILKQVFDQAGIPYNIDTREGFFQSILARTMHCFFACMLDPTDYISFLTILTSPMYQVNEQEIARLKIQHPNDFKQALFDTYQNVLKDLEYFASIANQDGLLTMLKEMANHNNFYVQLDDHEQANFDFLLEKVISVQDEVVSIMDLLNFMDQGQEEKSSEAISVGKDEDVVTVTTIHQSKGLQYPIVFLWSQDSNLDQDTRNKVYVDEEYYLGLYHVDSTYRTVRTTPRRIAIEAKNNIESLEEYTRLLYVALTRPQDQLYIVDAYKKDYPKLDITLPVLNMRNGMTGLILSTKLHDDRYFRVEHVTQAPLSHFENEIVQEKVQSFEHFQQEVVKNAFQKDFETFEKPVQTPSSFEFQFENFELEDLNPTPKQGRLYGTSLHEAIASLPNTTWSMDQILETGLSLNQAKKLEAFANSEFYQKALLGKIQKEYPFYIEVGQTRMQGTIDFFSIFEDKILLLDFKTDAKTQEELIESYTPQLKAYQKALHILYPDLPVEGYLYSFHLETLIQLF